jgi:nitrogen fixation NifU-like protein
MHELSELYQEVILDHNRRPRNFRAIEKARSAEGYNPLCGDRITVYLEMDSGRVADVSFQGTGCAISQASASVMTTVLKGKTVDEVESLFEKFKELVTGSSVSEADVDALGELAALGGVREFPTRVKCATLAWHALRSLLHGDRTVVTTE